MTQTKGNIDPHGIPPSLCSGFKDEYTSLTEAPYQHHSSITVACLLTTLMSTALTHQRCSPTGQTSKPSSCLSRGLDFTYQLTRVTRKQTLRSLSVSYQKKDGRMTTTLPQGLFSRDARHMYVNTLLKEVFLLLCSSEVDAVFCCTVTVFSNPLLILTCEIPRLSSVVTADHQILTFSLDPGSL